MVPLYSLAAYGQFSDNDRHRTFDEDVKSDDSISANKFKSAIWTWKVYRESQNLSILESICCFSYYIIGGVFKYV